MCWHCQRSPAVPHHFSATRSPLPEHAAQQEPFLPASSLFVSRQGCCSFCPYKVISHYHPYLCPTETFLRRNFPLPCSHLPVILRQRGAPAQGPPTYLFPTLPDHFAYSYRWHILPQNPSIVLCVYPFAMLLFVTVMSMPCRDYAMPLPEAVALQFFSATCTTLPKGNGFPRVPMSYILNKTLSLEHLQFCCRSLWLFVSVVALPHRHNQ